MKQLVLVLIGVAVMTTTFSQNNQRPTKSRFWNNKYSTFSIKPGDILVYSVSDNGQTSDLIVKVKKYGSTINFDYNMPNAGNRANTNIQAAAVSNANKYINNFGKTNMNLKNQTALWLSKSSYRNLASAGTTELDFGSGLQTFNRGNTGTLKINYKGKEKVVTLFNIESAEGESKGFGVLTDEKNPLILTMDNGAKMTLKEVR